jgi:hypothetical protein
MDLGEGGGTPFLPGRHPEKIQLTSAEESGGRISFDVNVELYPATFRTGFSHTLCGGGFLVSLR